MPRQGSATAPRVSPGSPATLAPILSIFSVPCDCNEQGSNSSVCDRDNGQCPCKPGVRGRRCEECQPDHFGFSPEGCTPCDCDPLGSEREGGVCDSETGECECVEGVTGRRCDECPRESVGPNRNMVTPCTDCFCNGYSQRCTPANGWYQANVVTGFNGAGIAMEGFRSDGDIFADRYVLQLNQGCMQNETIIVSTSLPPEVVLSLIQLGPPSTYPCLIISLETNELPTTNCCLSTSAFQIWHPTTVAMCL